MNEGVFFLGSLWLWAVKRSQIKGFIQLRDSCPGEACGLGGLGTALALGAFEQIQYSLCAFWALRAWAASSLCSQHSWLL